MTFCEFIKNDGLVKSPSDLSFRVKREILVSTTGEILLQPIEKIRFLPAVEMTHSTNLTFYDAIKNEPAKKKVQNNIYGHAGFCCTCIKCPSQK